MKSFSSIILKIFHTLIVIGLFAIVIWPDEILKKIPKGADYLAPLRRGIAFNRKGQCDRAIDCFNKAMEINPRIDDAYYGCGLAYYSKGEYDKDITDYTMVIELNPAADLAFMAYSNRASAYNRKGHYNKAISDCNKAIELNPSYARPTVIGGLPIPKKANMTKPLLITPMS